MQFFKATASSLVATGVQFLVTILLSNAAGGWTPAANVTGIICGGIANFLINRKVVYKKEEDAVNWQAIRYAIVWIGNLIIHSAGVWLLIHYSALPYKWAMVISSVMTFCCYNYVMQKRFVFK